MKAVLGDKVFVVLMDSRCNPDAPEIRPATVVRDWGGCVNLVVNLDGANDAMERLPGSGLGEERPVFTRWLTSISANEGGAPVGVDPKGTTIGNISGYFLNLASAEKAVADYRLVMKVIADKAVLPVEVAQPPAENAPEPTPAA